MEDTAVHIVGIVEDIVEDIVADIVADIVEDTWIAREHFEVVPLPVNMTEVRISSWVLAS